MLKHEKLLSTTQQNQALTKILHTPALCHICEHRHYIKERLWITFTFSCPVSLRGHDLGLADLGDFMHINEVMSM